MNKIEFLRMMVQDNETQKEPQKTLYSDVIECMDIALSQSPITVDIPSDKTAEGAYQEIKNFAHKNQRQSVGPFESVEIIAGYLGVKYVRATKKYSSGAAVNLDDFLD